MSLVSCVRSVSNLSEPCFPGSPASNSQALVIHVGLILRRFAVYQRHLEQQEVDAEIGASKDWKATSGSSSGVGEPDAPGRGLNLPGGRFGFNERQYFYPSELPRMKRGRVFPSNVNLCYSHLSVDLKSGFPRRMPPPYSTSVGV